MHQLPVLTVVKCIVGEALWVRPLECRENVPERPQQTEAQEEEYETQQHTDSVIKSENTQQRNLTVIAGGKSKTSAYKVHPE